MVLWQIIKDGFGKSFAGVPWDARYHTQPMADAKHCFAQFGYGVAPQGRFLCVAPSHAGVRFETHPKGSVHSFQGRQRHSKLSVGSGIEESERGNEDGVGSSEFCGLQSAP